MASLPRYCSHSVRLRRQLICDMGMKNANRGVLRDAFRDKRQMGHTVSLNQFYGVVLEAVRGTFEQFLPVVMLGPNQRFQPQAVFRIPQVVKVQIDADP